VTYRLPGTENGNPQLLSLPALADALKLPESWIKAEADAGRIPHLRIGKRYRFNHETPLPRPLHPRPRGIKFPISAVGLVMGIWYFLVRRE